MLVYASMRPCTHLWPISWTMTAVLRAEAPLRYLHDVHTESGSAAGMNRFEDTSGRHRRKQEAGSLRTHVQQV